VPMGRRGVFAEKGISCMRNAWATTLEQFWQSPTFPMWVTLAAAGFFAIILLLTLVRAEKTVANGALTVITLLAIAIAVAATVRRFDPFGSDTMLEARSTSPPVASVAALSCLDGLAGEAVEAPCERALFASADVAAAAVSYTAAQISKLGPSDDPAAQTPEQQSLRRTLERDRYGLVAQVLVARDQCGEADCQAFRLFTDTARIRANMRDRLYDSTISRYAATWNGASAASPAIAAVAPAMPTPGTTGRPTTIDFPSAASIPPVNIMTSEPSNTPAAAAQAAPKPVLTPPAPAINAQAAPHPPPPAAAKKPAVSNASAAVPRPRPIAPTQAAAPKPAQPAAPAPAADADADQ
jgi:hypothetical protein